MENNPQKKTELPQELDREVSRLRLLAQFAGMKGRAKEIELEWQRIQQDEHDYEFAFKVKPNDETQGRFLHKKGVVDGVKWCIERFS